MDSEKTTVSKSKLSYMALLSLFLSLWGFFFLAINTLPTFDSKDIDTQLKFLNIIFPFGSSIPFYASFFAPYFGHVIALIALARLRRNPLLRGKRIAMAALVLSFLWMLLWGVVYMFGDY